AAHSQSADFDVLGERAVGAVWVVVGRAVASTGSVAVSTRSGGNLVLRQLAARSRLAGGTLDAARLAATVPVRSFAGGRIGADAGRSRLCGVPDHSLLGRLSLRRSADENVPIQARSVRCNVESQVGRG